MNENEDKDDSEEFEDKLIQRLGILMAGAFGMYLFWVVTSVRRWLRRRSESRNIKHD